MTTEPGNKIASMEAFRRKAKYDKPADKNERVWDRAERLYNKMDAQNAINTPKAQCQETWESAVKALLQYMDNEWSVEKHNKIRANDIAEKAATLFFKGISQFPQSSKPVELQTKVLEAFEEQGFPDALQNYRTTVTKMADAQMAAMAARQEPG